MYFTVIIIGIFKYKNTSKPLSTILIGICYKNMQHEINGLLTIIAITAFAMVSAPTLSTINTVFAYNPFADNPIFANIKGLDNKIFDGVSAVDPESGSGDTGSNSGSGSGDTGSNSGSGVAAVAIPLQVVQHAVAVERVLSIGIVKEPITIVSRESKSVFCSVVEVNKSG